MSEYAAFLIATLIGAFLSGITWWFARRSGLQPAQKELIDTLKDNADALGAQLIIVKSQLDTEIQKRRELEVKVDHLQKTVVDLAAENTRLRQRLGRVLDPEVS